MGDLDEFDALVASIDAPAPDFPDEPSPALPQAPSYEADLALWHSVVSRDADAVRTLVDDYLPRVFGFVLARVAGSQTVAEDLIQETLLEAMRASSTFRGEASLTTWLCTIARSRVARFYERERRQEAVARQISLVPETPEQIIDLRDEVLQALATLPPVHRQVLVMKYLDGRSVQDIAVRTERSAVQVQSLLQRAREGFRRSMGRNRV